MSTQISIEQQFNQSITALKEKSITARKLLQSLHIQKTENPTTVSLEQKDITSINLLLIELEKQLTGNK